MFLNILSYLISLPLVHTSPAYNKRFRNGRHCFNHLMVLLSFLKSVGFLVFCILSVFVYVCHIETHCVIFVIV